MKKILIELAQTESPGKNLLRNIGKEGMFVEQSCAELLTLAILVMKQVMFFHSTDFAVKGFYGNRVPRDREKVNE